jgi:hypothetical protein
MNLATHNKQGAPKPGSQETPFTGNLGFMDKAKKGNAIIY